MSELLKMGLKIDGERVKQLKEFVALCRANPDVLNVPELAFFKEWLVRCGVHAVPSMVAS